MGAGGFGGSRIIGPSSGGAWTRSPSYGVRAPKTVPVRSNSIRVIENHARKLKVPWPRTGTTRAADMSPHNVYQIFARTKSGKVIVWRYGITKVGASRPRSQLKACEAALGVDCHWDWVRTDVKGWLKARRVEAGYATKYKSRFGKCPKGMRRCL
jgi:hypothetical protein